jgi:hypothetical protein
MKTNYLITLIFVSLAAGHVSAQTAANWNFNGNSLNASTASNATSSAAALSATTAGSFNASSEYYGEGGWPAGTIDPTVYLQFTLSANTGYYLSLNGVTIVIRRSTTGTAAGSGPQQWSLRSSLDNYTTDITSGTLTTSYVSTAVSLPTAFQSIPGSVSFRLYGYNMVITAGGNNRFVFDNVSIQGQALSSVLAEQSISLQAKADQQQDKVQLQWNTIGFAAGTQLQIERSVDGTNFSTIDRQQISIATDAAFQYEDISVPVSSRIWYRVTATEPDGRIYRSTLVAVEGKAGQAMQIVGIVPQGSGTSVKALLNTPEEGQYQVVLLSLDGKTLSRRLINGGMGRQTMDLDLGYHPHGAYILTLLKGGQATSREFID